LIDAIHFHMLFLDGVYIAGTRGASARFHRVDEPPTGKLTQLVHKIAHRLGRYLERRGCRVQPGKKGVQKSDQIPLIMHGTDQFLCTFIGPCCW